MGESRSPWLALHAGEDPDHACRTVRRAHEDFLTSGAAPGSLRPVVLDSWRRSLAAGVDPDGARLPPVKFTAEDLDEYRRSHPLAVVLPVFREFLGGIAEDGEHIMAVSDAVGRLLWVEGHTAVQRRAERMNFVAGAAWDEASAGTNAPGTALSLDHAVQIFSTEHFCRVVQSWTCSAAPIHDPETGEVLGVIDVTGGDHLATPHSLALVQATARAAEAELARRQERRREALRARFFDQVTHVRAPVALVSSRGQVLAARPGGWVDGRIAVPAPGESLTLPDGRTAVAEPLGAHGDVVLRVISPRGATSSRPAGAGQRLRIEALCRDEALLTVRGRRLRLSRRHSEILVILTRYRHGLSSERLGLELYGDAVHPVTLRAEMSRLRTLLGADIVGSRPYAVRGDIEADFLTVRDLLARGKLRAALRRYRGPLLPVSDAPAVREERICLEQQLRAALLASQDPALLREWVDAPWGADDLQAWEALVAALPPASSRRAVAAARVRALRAEDPAPRVHGPRNRRATYLQPRHN